MCIPLIRLRAAFDQYPDTGRAGVALALSKSDDVLRKEASGSSPTHKLGFTDALRAIECLQNAGVDVEPVLASIAAHFGYRLAGGVGASEHEPDLNILSSMANQEIAELALAVITANADGSISSNEHKAVQAKAIDAKDAISKLVRAVDAQHAREQSSRASE